MLWKIMECPSSKVPGILFKTGKFRNKEEVVNTGQRPDQVLMLYMHQNTKKIYNFT